MAKRSSDSLVQLQTVSDLFGDDAVQANQVAILLKEATSLRGAEKRLKEIKVLLKEALSGAPGVRQGNQCCIVRFQAGKASLKPALLVENGVTPEQIEASTTRGEGYYVCELPFIGEDNEENN